MLSFFNTHILKIPSRKTNPIPTWGSLISKLWIFLGQQVGLTLKRELIECECLTFYIETRVLYKIIEILRRKENKMIISH